jgi:hypothetical protein
MSSVQFILAALARSGEKREVLAKDSNQKGTISSEIQSYMDSKHISRIVARQHPHSHQGMVNWTPQDAMLLIQVMPLPGTLPCHGCTPITSHGFPLGVTGMRTNVSV